MVVLAGRDQVVGKRQKAGYCAGGYGIGCWYGMGW